MFARVSSEMDFAAMELEILAWWEEKETVQKYLARNEKAKATFSFIDGPITANNPMGVHHAWGRMYKDLFQRYKTMKGFRQRYQNGFDGQGLWIEVEVEKEQGFNSKREIEAFGVGRFVELCKARVRKFADIMTQQSIRLGYWMDWSNSYHTMSDENNYTIWHFLKECHRRGWIYEGTDVMPWCPRCGTGLSQHEIVTEGYQEIVHPGLYVRLPLVDDGSVIKRSSRDKEALLIWTTTPWTLTSNTGAYVHPDLLYAKVCTDDGEVLYLLKSRLSELGIGCEILEEMPGRELEGLRYRGPFDELPAQNGVDHRVVLWEEVSEAEGTGIVHTAPGAGEVDFVISKKEGLDVIAPLDEFGNFIEGFDWLSGKNVSKVNDLIYESLKKKGIFFRLDDYSHRYPVCWRCDTELVFRLVDEWFISMKELRHDISEVTKTVKWIPSFGMDRELDWLRNMDDWMISKKRYWGLALPIYKCECGHFEVLGDQTELCDKAVEGWSQFEGHSPHRPWIDAVKIKCEKCGAIVERIRDVGNPWLDAGIVPFSTIDYRTNRTSWQEWFPADWISESFPGQFRNWFYSLLTMSTVLEKTAPTRAIFSYATMRDENGEEMHKSKGNSIEFEEAANKMGVDSMRWLYARQNPAANINFGFGAADEVRRRFLIQLWNIYSFFVTYANIDRYDPQTPGPPIEERPELDRWIISELNSLVAEVTVALDGYGPDKATQAVEGFIEYLSNWYIRRTRRRFWKEGILSHTEGVTDRDKLSAYATLYECLTTLTKLLAPFMPFVTEKMYQNLVASKDRGSESVHLEPYPEADISRVDVPLSEATRLAMRIASLGRAARSRAGIKVRQPLASVIVGPLSAKEEEHLALVKNQVKDELNVKEIKIIEEETEVRNYVELSVRANTALLGPKYGSELPQVVAALSSVDPLEVYLRKKAGHDINVAGYELIANEVQIVISDKPFYSANTTDQIIVAIDKRIDPELAAEGMARELVRRIQNMRKAAGFDIADYIITFYQGNEEFGEMLSNYGEYICRETLSRELVKASPEKEMYSETHTLDGVTVVLGVRRLGEEVT